MAIKEELDKIMSLEGKVRGVTFQTDAEYVKKHFGGEALTKAKEQLAAWGGPIEYEKIQAMGWYPVGLRILSLLAIQVVLNLDDEQIKAMGNEAPKHSFIIKLLAKFVLSIKQTFNKAPEMWKKHYSVGEIFIGEINEPEKYVFLQVRNFSPHPIYCKYLEGYFLRIAQYIIDNPKSEETKCVFKGAQYHEYKFTW